MKSLIVFLTFLMVGCSSMNDSGTDKARLAFAMASPVHTPPPVVPGEAKATSAGDYPRPGVYAIITHSPAPTPWVFRAVVRNDQSIDTEFANLILFAREPVTIAEHKTYVNICKYWTAYFLPDQEDVVRNTTEINHVVVKFYWMITNTSEVVRDCEQLVKHYDYARAHRVMRARKLDTTRNQIACLLPEGAVVMNLSRLKKPEDIDLAFMGWARKMTVIPKSPSSVYVYNLATSFKAVVGALGHLVGVIR